MSFENIDDPVSDELLSGGLDDGSAENKEGQQNVADSEGAAESNTESAGAGKENAESNANDEGAAEHQEPATERAQVIPRARFDEVNAKLHAQREEVERLRAELESSRQKPAEQSAPEGGEDIKAMIRQSKEALLEGDLDRAAELEYQIQQATQRNAEARIRQQIEQSNAEARKAGELAQLNDTASKIIQSYPFLDTSSPNANAEAIAEVVEWRDFYISKGDAPHEALSKAANKVAPGYVVAPQAAAPADARKQAALARNAADALAQPPAAAAGVGNRAAPPTPKVESQKDWEKLSESEREALLM